jgi:hypothetical protein
VLGTYKTVKYADNLVLLGMIDKVTEIENAMDRNKCGKN